MRSKFLLVSLTLIASSIPACSIPEGDQASPTGIHYRWIQARANGSADALWDLLDPAVKKEFERWLIAERLVVAEIKSAYPKEDATAALAAMGGDKRGEATDPKALFSMIVKPPPAMPGLMGAVSAHVRSEEVQADGKSAVLKTFGGDELTVVKGDDDRWYMTLPADDLERLKNARALAEQNLERVRNNLKKLGRTP